MEPQCLLRDWRWGGGVLQRKFGGAATKARRMGTHERNHMVIEPRQSSRHSAQVSCYQPDLSSLPWPPKAGRAVSSQGPTHGAEAWPQGVGVQKDGGEGGPG